jgi:DNA-3-methyladenine glycosylase
MSRLTVDFFDRPTLTVARELIGKRLIKVEGRTRLGGLISEVEAYIGESDLACHARHGRTPRTDVMYWRAGHLYVYFTYGMHWMMNFITEREGYPAAVLLRAIAPVEGLPLMQQRRGRYDQVSDGPGKVTQALGIDKSWNGYDLCVRGAKLFIEDEAHGVAASAVQRTPRIGLGATPEPWLSKKWNFKMKQSSNL